MVVPDFDLISEIMLVAEGFTEARLLARKFITLYTLCKELLSKQVIKIDYWMLTKKFQIKKQTDFLKRITMIGA